MTKGATTARDARVGDIIARTSGRDSGTKRKVISIRESEVRAVRLYDVNSVVSIPLDAQCRIWRELEDV